MWCGCVDVLTHCECDGVWCGVLGVLVVAALRTVLCFESFDVRLVLLRLFSSQSSV